jgi:hypothetical protein
MFMYVILWHSQYIDYIASNGRVTDELEKIWKEAVTKLRLPFQWLFEGPEGAMKNLLP